MRQKRLHCFLLILLFNSAVIHTSAQMRQVYVDTVATNNNIVKLSFYTAAAGWIAGYDDALTWVGHTTDTGRTITKKYISNGNVHFNGNDVNLSYGFDVKGVHAFSQNRLLLYGDYGLVPSILYSDNGGTSFSLVFHSQYDDFQLSTGITSMTFPNNGQVGYATDADRVLKTSDGGLSWSVVKDDPNSFFENIQAIDNNSLFAYSKKESGGKLIKSLDAGLSWQELALPFTSINAAYFISATQGWLNVLDSNYTGLTYRTNNGGLDWTLLNNSAITPFATEKMLFISDSVGFALGDIFTVYKTSDSGKVWEPLSRSIAYKDAGASHNDLYFFNNQLWATGYRSLIELNTTIAANPLPKAYFAIDTTGLAATGQVQLKNYSRNSYQFKWYVNNQLVGTTYNSAYNHIAANALDSVKLVVTSGAFKDSLTKFQFFTAVPPIPIPKIDSFAPTSNYKDYTVTIYGSNFSGVGTVKFGNVPARSFTVVSPGVIKAVVGNGASGAVTVSNINGSNAKNGFVYLTRLSIKNFTPIRGRVGSTVIITGSNFSTTAGENTVYFGAVKAVVLAATTTQLAVQVPPGITYVPISVTVNGATVFSNIPFTVSFDAGCAFNYHSLASRKDLPSQLRITSVGTADLDGDGKPDVITGSENNRHLTYMRNTSAPGQLSFDTEQLLMTEVNNGAPGKFCVSDFDGDGKMDIGSINGNFPWGFSVFKNSSTPGNIGFKPAQVTPDNFNNRPKFIHTADFDDDGKPEVIGLWNRGVYVYKNNSKDSFISFKQPDLLISTNSGGEAAGFVATDIDGDGRKDIVVSSYFFYNRLTVFRNKSVDSTVLFDTPEDFLYGTGNSNKNLIAAGDMNNDGRVDIVTLAMNANNRLSVMSNTSAAGQINFTESLNIPFDLYPSSISLSDVNGDGKTDILISLEFERSLSVLLNQSVGSTIAFAPPIHLGIEANPYSRELVMVDADLDGKQDIVTINYRTNGTPFDFNPAVVIYRNQFCEGNASAICANESTSFTKTATGGSSFQWQQDNGSGFVNISNNSIFSGTSTNQLTIASPPTSWYGHRFRCLVDGIAASDTFTIKFAATWLGKVSTAWDNALNWGCGGVPDGNTDVIIPSGTVEVNANANCRSLISNYGVSVNIVPGADLKVTH